MKALFILGPTAVGKTAISVKLAKLFNGEIISCDSVQVYKGMDIGSAKIKKEETEGVPHHLIDIVSPKEDFTAFQFVLLMKEKIKEISERNKLPIVVGGTSLYVKSLILNYNFGGAGKDENLRKKLEVILKNEGVEKLYSKLEEVNKSLALKTEKDNPVRVIRAIEIALGSGEKTSSKSEIDSLIFALTMEREKLYERINLRVDMMLDEGLVEEVKRLKEEGLTRENSSMKAIGYKEVLSFLDNEISYERMVELIKQHSRNYAKRQLTFLRGMENINYIDAEEENAFQKICEKVKEWLNG